MAINDLRGVRVGFNQVADLIENGEIITDLDSATPASGDSIMFSDVSDSNNSKKGLISALADTVASYLNISSGTYTPTLTNSTNVAASTAYLCQYLRVGSVVTVSGRVDIDPTSTGDTQLGLSLPIASNLGNIQDLGGTLAATTTANFGGIYGDATNDRALIRFPAVTTANIGFHFIFSYRII